MEVEGAELESLKGARRIIQRDTPQVGNMHLSQDGGYADIVLIY